MPKTHTDPESHTHKTWWLQEFKPNVIIHHEMDSYGAEVYRTAGGWLLCVHWEQRLISKSLLNSDKKQVVLLF